MALASQGELSTHVDVGEDEDSATGESNSDIDKLKSLLRHLGLEHFEAAVHRAGVLSLAQMASVADNVLMSQAVGLRKVHIRKLREECRARILAARLNYVQDIENTSVGSSDRGRGTGAPIDGQNTSSTTMAMDADDWTEVKAQVLSPPPPPDAAKETEDTLVGDDGDSTPDVAAAVRKQRPVQHMAVSKLPQAPLQKRTFSANSPGKGEGTLL